MKSVHGAALALSLLLASQAWARAPVLADYREWSLACDNTGACHAFGVMHGDYDGGLPPVDRGG